MQILALSPSLLEASQLLAVGQRILDLPHTPKHDFVSAIRTLVEGSLLELGKALGRVKASAHTAALADCDAKRDDAYLALREHAKSLARRSDVQLREAGRALRALIASYGSNLARLGYTEASGKVKALLADLADAKYAAHVATAKAGELVAELAAAQQAFEQTEAARSAEQAAKDEPLLKPSTQRVGADLSLYLGVLSALPRLQPPVSIDALVPELNETITRAMSVAHARQTRAETAAEEAAPGASGTASAPAGAGV